MRLLHIHSGNLYGGVERVLRTMARYRALAPRIEPVFALSYDGRIAAELRAERCEVHILGAARARHPLSVFQARARLAALCAKSPFHAAIVHSPWSLALLAPAATCPVILYQHDLPGGPQWTDLWAGCRKPDLVIANSDFVRERYLRLHPDSTVVTIHPPVSLASSRISGEARRELRARWGASESSTVILQAARFEPWKGHRLLRDALTLLRPNPNWRLWIAGAAQRPSERKLELELRATSDRVTFLGHVTDMASVMEAADIYCQPNTEPEPFGLCFVEALHSGSAVVSTRLGGAEEILAPEWGLLPSPDPASVAGALERLIGEVRFRRELAAAGPTRARILCGPGKQIGLLADAVESLHTLDAAA